MIFADTNVFMSCTRSVKNIHKEHPRREQTREFFRTSGRKPDRLCTSTFEFYIRRSTYPPSRSI